MLRIDLDAFSRVVEIEALRISQCAAPVKSGGVASDLSTYEVHRPTIEERLHSQQLHTVTMPSELPSPWSREGEEPMDRDPRPHRLVLVIAR
jgi:hypothetical protein